MVSLIQAIILGFVQGITEWLPVSSSGHLALLQNFFGFQNISFDVFLHLASVLALIIFFRKDIIAIMKKGKRNYFLKIFIALLPAAIAGFLLKDYIESNYHNLFSLGIFFMISGIIVYSTKFFRPEKNKISYFDSLFIGLFQALAILPGVSRSGATISSALYRKIKNNEAVTFSFLLAVPIILGAFILDFPEIVNLDVPISVLFISFMVTFLTSIATIKVLITIIRRESFYLFGIYNFVLGLLLVVWQVLN